jgi:hypothetical protein
MVCSWSHDNPEFGARGHLNESGVSFRIVVGICMEHGMVYQAPGARGNGIDGDVCRLPNAGPCLVSMIHKSKIVVRLVINITEILKHSRYKSGDMAIGWMIVQQSLNFIWLENVVYKLPASDKLERLYGILNSPGGI